MFSVKDLEQVSILGRFAFGLVCLERAYDHFVIKSDKMDWLLDHLWTALEREDLGAWEREFMDFFSNIRKDAVDRDHELGRGHLPEGLRAEFIQFMDNVISILADTYILPLKQGPCETADIPLVKATAEFMVRHNIPLPPIQKFAQSSFRENFGWGNPCDPSLFRERPPRSQGIRRESSTTPPGR